jgi:hypothetical protein
MYLETALRVMEKTTTAQIREQPILIGVSDASQLLTRAYDRQS